MRRKVWFVDNKEGEPIVLVFDRPVNMRSVREWMEEHNV